MRRVLFSGVPLCVKGLWVGPTGADCHQKTFAVSESAALLLYEQFPFVFLLLRERGEGDTLPRLNFKL